MSVSVCRVVLSYLVHHGYSKTAQVFAASTGQGLEEDTVSIRSRQSMCVSREIADYHNNVISCRDPGAGSVWEDQ